MKIPFVNLREQYQSISTEIDQAIHRVARSGSYIGGPEVKSFEENYARLIQVSHCIGTGNGTDSLFLILKALGIGTGDEVIVPAWGCIPTAEAVSLTGATIKFADVLPSLYTIDPASAEKCLSSKTKAIIAVHLYGQAAAIQELTRLCRDKNIFLVEDCAQAQLTLVNNKPVGSIGIASAFSFYPTKNLGGMGDGGCVATNDNSLAEKIRRLANHGALQKHDHEIEGTNSRLDPLQAAILDVKLRHLSQWTRRRREIAMLYKNLLGGISGINLPDEAPGCEHSFHIFCIRTKKRDLLLQHLAENGVEAMIHYPTAIPFLRAYDQKGFKSSDFPVSSSLQNEVLSLPVFPELEQSEIEYIAGLIRKFF